MKKLAILLLVSALIAGCSRSVMLSDDTLKTLEKLDRVIDTKDDLQMQKEERIASIRKSISNLDATSPVYDRLLYDSYKRICDEYIKFNADSAMHYALLKLEFIRSKGIKTRDDVWDAYHSVAERYMLSGMYEEANSLITELEQVTGEHPSHLLHTLYNGLQERSSDAQLKAEYIEKANAERNRMYAELPEDHIARWYVNGDILLESGKPQEAYHFLIAKYEDSSLNHSQKAIIAYLIGNAFNAMEKTDEAILWYAESACHDLIDCSREYSSLPALASKLYEIGDVKRAYRYITRSIDDAQSLNVLMNVQKINDILPVITNSYNKEIRENSARMLTLIVILAILVAVMITAVVLAFSNAAKVHRISKALQSSNEKLATMNAELKSNMEALRESDRLKQAYIGRYLDQCSYYIGRIEKYRSHLRKILKNGDMEEMRQALKSDDYINNELKDFYSQFDATFLDLFPDFIDRLNSLLKPEARIDINPEEGILTTELRVLALIQLGVTDSIKISEFLRRSVSTVYNYRVKLRNASVLNRDDFENELVKRF